MIKFALRAAPAVATILATLTVASAAESVGAIRSVTADAYGNAVIITEGGAKVIAVGQGAAMAQAFAATPSAADAATNCRNVGIYVRGRSYMYGLSDGDPVPVMTKRVCD